MCNPNASVTALKKFSLSFDTFGVAQDIYIMRKIAEKQKTDEI